jgi:transposase-like protein
MKPTNRKLLARIRTAYEKGDGTIKELAERFGVNYFTLRNRSVREKWSSGRSGQVTSAPCLVLPEAFEALWREFGVAHGIPNTTMPEKSLNAARVPPVVSQLITRRVPQHVRMHWERKPCRHAVPWHP